MIHHNKYLAVVISLLLVTTGCGGSQSTAPQSTVSPATSQSSSPSSSTVSTAPALGNAAGFTVVVEPQYDLAYSFTEGLALVGKRLSDDDAPRGYSYSYIDKSGKTAFTLPPEITDASPFRKGKAKVYRTLSDANDNNGDSTFNYVDNTGKLLLDSWCLDDRGYGGGEDETSRYIYFGEAEPASNEPNYIVVSSEKGCSLLNDDLKTIIPYGKYDAISWVYGTDFVIVTNYEGDKSFNTTSTNGILKTDGSTFLEMEYSAISYIQRIGFSLTKKGSTAAELKLTDGKTVTPQGHTAAAYEYISRDDVISFAVSANGNAYSGTWGVMDLSGKVLVEPTNPDLFQIPGYESSPWLWADIVEPATDELDFPLPKDTVLLAKGTDTCVVSTGEQYDENFSLRPEVRVGIADLKGNWLVEPKLDGVSNIVRGMYIASTGLEITVGDDYNTSWHTGYQLVLADGSKKSEVYDSIDIISDGMIRVMVSSPTGSNRFGFIRVE